MREELQKREGKRGLFTAKFERYGRCTGWQGRELVTLLFRDVRDSTGRQVTDHIWFKQCKAFNFLGLKPGDEIKMEARVKPYHKGYRGRRSSDGWSGEESGGGEIDFKLAFPTKVEIVRGFAAGFDLLASVACQGCGSGVESGRRLCEKCEKRMD